MLIGLIAEPWWVNLTVLAPVLAYCSWRRGGVPLTTQQLVISGVFAVSFGFVEASVVVYLRAAVGLLPGCAGTLSDLQHASEVYQQAKSITQFPPGLLTIEMFRE